VAVLQAQTLADARKAVAAEVLPFLERADRLLGDGMVWLRREVHDIARYGVPVQHERIDALVDVANALLRGETVEQAGLMAEYKTPEPAWTGDYKVQWIPKSSAPAVGYFPNPVWQQSPHQGEAIRLLTAAGLIPAHFGEYIGIGGWMCESEGFMVSAADTDDSSVPGLWVSPAGNSAGEQQARVPAVMREAGWRVQDDPAWPGTWEVFPPGE
jgi:hypothetical protein